MNIFNRVSLQGLKKARTRTIVTIIGVILSVAMFAAVTTFVASLQHTLIESTIAETGDWHVKFSAVDADFVSEISEDKAVRKFESRPHENDEETENSDGKELLSEQEAGDGTYDVYVALKSPGKVYDYAESKAEASGIVDYAFNGALLRALGVSTNEHFNAVLYSLCGILIALIMVGSVLLIYNSFAISVSERTRQFGILSSVGATKRQLKKSVLFEGMCIGIIGIPIGLASGVLGIGITLNIIGNIFGSMTEGIAHLSLKISVPALLIAAIIGALTILISAYIPAKRAVRLSAIDTIRQSDDIKINPKSIKTSKIVSSVFGLEGTLAMKNFKRNKKRYRATVISLFVSIVLFISASAFGMYLKQGTEMTIGDYDFDITFRASQGTWHLPDDELIPLYNQMKTADGVYASAYENVMNSAAPIPKSALTKRYLEYDGYDETTDETITSSVGYHFIDDEGYQRYMKSLKLDPTEYGVEKGKFPVVAKIQGYDPEEQRTVSIDIFNENSITIVPTKAERALQLENMPSQSMTFTVVDTVPEGFKMAQLYEISVFLPYSDKAKIGVEDALFNGISMSFSSHDPKESAAEMESMVEEAGISEGYSLFNIADALEQSRNVILVINIFTFGFVILISLITIANVFNTVSTSISLRRREFAMLRSIGMDNRGFNKMMNFECIFYGLKALLYGLPVSALVTYLIFKGIQNGVDVGFSLPWSSIAISVFSVFFIVFITMMYATSKINKANVIDALRSE